MTNEEKVFVTMPKKMIGVATAQNTVNTVPAIQLDIKEFLFIQTIGEAQNNWVKNALAALNHKMVLTPEPIILPKDIDDNLIEITKHVKNSIKSDPYIFNIGGGLKVHSLALWELFIHRNNSQDLACYSNPQKGVIDFWKWENNNIKQFTVPLDFDDELENFLKVFGFSLEDPGIKLFENGKTLYENKHFDFFQFQEFREFLSLSLSNKLPIKDGFLTVEQARNLVNFKNSEIKEELFETIKRKNPSQIIWTDKQIRISIKLFKTNLIGQILKFIRDKLIIPENSKTSFYEFKDLKLKEELKKRNLPNNFSCNSNSVRAILGESSGFYFEKILMIEIVEILNKGGHNIKKAFANVKIKSKDAKAEFDILLLTNQGTFYVLDGKLDEFDKKDENSRKLNVLKSGGAFSSFIPIFSFYPSDLGSSWLSSSILKKIKDYHLEGVKFMVFNQNENEVKKATVLNEDVNLPHFSDIVKYLNISQKNA